MQLSGHSRPRVLCLGATYWGAVTVLNRLAAEWLLTSEPRIVVNRSSAVSNAVLETALEQSAFFRWEGDKVVPCRQSVSAVILASLSNDSCCLVGLLHPEPAYRFQPEVLPDVPFVAVANWPPADEHVRTRWSVPGSGVRSVLLRKIPC